MQVLYCPPGLLVEFPLKQQNAGQAGKVFFAINDKAQERKHLIVYLKKTFSNREKSTICLVN